MSHLFEFLKEQGLKDPEELPFYLVDESMVPIQRIRKKQLKIFTFTMGNQIIICIKKDKGWLEFEERKIHLYREINYPVNLQKVGEMKIFENETIKTAKILMLQYMKFLTVFEHTNPEIFHFIQLNKYLLPKSYVTSKKDRQQIKKILYQGKRILIKLNKDRIQIQREFPLFMRLRDSKTRTYSFPVELLIHPKYSKLNPENHLKIEKELKRKLNLKKDQNIIFLYFDKQKLIYEKLDKIKINLQGGKEFGYAIDPPGNDDFQTDELLAMKLNQNSYDPKNNFKYKEPETAFKILKNDP